MMNMPPNDITLRLLYILHIGLSDLRHIQSDEDAALRFDLADALENIPGFMVDWNANKVTEIEAQLVFFEKKYTGKIMHQRYSKYLKSELVPEKF